MNKPKLINGVLWLALLLAVGASISHLAWTFGTVERAGQEWRGWIPAVAVDAGLVAMAYAIQQRKKTKRPTRWLWVGVIWFAVISALANLYHALSVEGIAPVANAALLAKALLLSATLPAMVIFLGEIVSGDDAEAVAKAEHDKQRTEAKEERDARRREQETANEAKRLQLEEQRLLLEATKAAAQSEPEAEPSEIIAVVCEDCGRSFRSVNARNAHKCGEKVNGTNGNGKHREG